GGVRTPRGRPGRAHLSAGRIPVAEPEPGHARPSLQPRPARRRPDRAEIGAMVAPLVLTLGEPAGVGPEIIASASRALSGAGTPFAVLGDARLLKAQGVTVTEIGGP